MSNTSVNCTNNSIASFEYVSNVLVYFWVMCFLAVIGVVNNSLVICVYYRLKWYREKKMILFVNLSILDLLTCFSSIVLFSSSLFDIYINKSETTNQRSCVIKLSRFYGFCIASSTCSFGIAGDRLMSKLWTYKWHSCYDTTFRIAIVILSWTWGVCKELGFIFTADPSHCISFCISTIDYPRNLLYTASIIVTDSMAGMLIIIYAIIPYAAVFRLKQCLKAGVILNSNVSKMKQDQFVKRLRLISGIYIGCYLISIIPALMLTDVLFIYPGTNSGVNFIVSLFSNFCFFFNSFLPIYIWLFDAHFRRELVSLLSHVFCIFKFCNSFDLKSP